MPTTAFRVVAVFPDDTHDEFEVDYPTSDAARAAAVAHLSRRGRGDPPPMYVVGSATVDGRVESRFVGRPGDDWELEWEDLLDVRRFPPPSQEDLLTVRGALARVVDETQVMVDETDTPDRMAALHLHTARTIARTLAWVLGAYEPDEVPGQIHRYMSGAWFEDVDPLVIAAAQGSIDARVAERLTEDIDNTTVEDL